jgi:hypothetical protein
MTFGAKKAASNLRNMAVGVKKPLRTFDMALLTWPLEQTFEHRRLSKSSFALPNLTTVHF